MTLERIDTTYLAARAAMKAATAKFDLVRAAYRTREIGDAEYLAGRAEWLAAEAVFDLAYAETLTARYALASHVTP
jgi:hypothetical protein